MNYVCCTLYLISFVNRVPQSFEFFVGPEDKKFFYCVNQVNKVNEVRSRIFSLSDFIIFFLLLVFVFSAVLEDFSKFFIIETTLFIDRSVSEHFVYLVVGHTIAHCRK